MAGSYVYFFFFFLGAAITDCTHYLISEAATLSVLNHTWLEGSIGVHLAAHMVTSPTTR